MRTPLLVSTLLVACGGGSGGTVSLDTTGTPQLVALKLGTGDWQPIAVSGNHYEITANEPYIVAVACNDVVDLFDTYLFARTPEDTGDLSAPCTGEGPPLDGRILGTATQASEIRVGFNGFATANTNEAFQIEASTGLHDVIAQTSAAILIRRNVQVDGDTEIAPIDVATEGAPFTPTRFTLTTEPDEDTFAFMELFTEHNTIMFQSGTPSTLALVPEAVLTPADRQLVVVAAQRGTLSRRVTFGNARAPRDVDLPPYLEGAALTETGGTIAATWGALPEHDFINITVDQTIGSGLRYHTLTISSAYADEMGTAITLDLAIPGFDPMGAIDVTGEYNRAFDAFTDRNNELHTSRLSESLNPPTAAKPHRMTTRKRMFTR